MLIFFKKHFKEGWHHICPYFSFTSHWDHPSLCCHSPIVLRWSFQRRTLSEGNLLTWQRLTLVSGDRRTLWSEGSPKVCVCTGWPAFQKILQPCCLEAPNYLLASTAKFCRALNCRAFRKCNQRYYLLNKKAKNRFSLVLNETSSHFRNQIFGNTYYIF